VILRRFDGLLHGFVSMAPLVPACEAAVRDIVSHLTAMISTAE
jgi:hypothetical protein